MSEKIGVEKVVGTVLKGFGIGLISGIIQQVAASATAQAQHSKEFSMRRHGPPRPRKKWVRRYDCKDATGKWHYHYEQVPDKPWYHLLPEHNSTPSWKKNGKTF